jgi:prevent-host-death family protein
MAGNWEFQEAKDRFSDVVEAALKTGPQTIIRRGSAVVVVLSVRDYRRLTQRRESLAEFFANSPLRGVDLDLERDKDLPREVDL